MLSDTVREYEALINEEMRQKKAEPLVNGKSGTTGVLFADFIEHDWLEAVRRGDRKAVKRKVVLGTFGGYQLNVTAHIAPYFREKGTLLSELTAEDINDYYDYQYLRTVKNTGKPIKAMTVTKHHANIYSSLQYASRKNYIDGADSILKNVIRPEAEEFLAKPYNEDEAIKLIEAVRGNALELYVIIGAFYGLRRSEIIGLRWESIDFDANQITIEHTVTVTEVDGVRIVDAKDKVKGKSSFRSLPLHPIVRTKLLAVKEEQAHNRQVCGRCYNREQGDVYIFVDALGNRINPDKITSAFPAFLKRNNLRRIRPHDLRHTSARLLLAAGIPLEAIKVWLGHSTYAITEKIYARFDMSINKVSADALKWFEKTSLAQTCQNNENSDK